MSVAKKIINDFIDDDMELNKLELSKLTKEELIDKYIDVNNHENLQENLLLNVSHDLRSPLNVILSILQFYESGYITGSDNMSKYMTSIKRNSYRMLKLIDNLIDTTRLDKNYYKIERRNLDIVKLIENTISSIDKYAKQKNISLIFDTNVEKCIMAIDPEAIDRIIMNLLSNAIKFSYNDGNVYINLWKRNNQLNISVKDEGMGIPLKEQKKIFNRFMQSSNHKKIEQSGSGIGLALVESLTKAHNGKILLNSEEDRGSEFIIKLPIIKLSENNEDNHIINAKTNIEMLEIEFSDIYL
ncbi:HAMP domain-containing histidine kinase [Clostridium botulinum]|uniref:sensor histidine kinase n=1 Tax=unclassified Clostridium TaxID=2614128 RepID=UPI0013CAF403|nr:MULTISPECIES: HAMP domain-containing sensor histidine kinase [unclassified Clostridium]NFN77719.1 HAMP domain-containing histidine kinase [Clostridium botulinum]NFO78493.1 HAMP domain-containing histidine kinase [Clostridium botulinum]NFP05631.1 HAMP domain-containing histidine kinase [Clostridium botulinum]NFR99617.1 HAMP domain-containing histidine kinase [Clostridium botulinum]NFT97291.1 HAMP domain-containing histidine kinase [Clostridium botulinum]